MDCSDNLIQHLELASAKAWPAEESRLLDGWTLRANKGITWRANSVLPLSDLKNFTLEEAIAAVIEYYTTRNIPPAFKLTHHCHPRDLDIVLDAMGFSKEMETYVQAKALPIPSDNGGKLSARISTEMDQEWINAYSKLGKFESLALQCRLEIMSRIGSMKGFAQVEALEEIIGIGMGVLQDDMLGLFGIVTEPIHRRKGVGMSINAALMEWGRCNGAKTAYLQVEKQNKPAIALYAKCGFEICYDYWYRILRS